MRGAMKVSVYHRFMLAQDKPLFTLQDVSELLGVKRAEVLRLARRFNVSVANAMFSAWQVRQLIVGLQTGKTEGVRFDRCALVWQLLRHRDDPLEPPTFQEAWEQEIARVAQLPEPARTLRSQALWGQMADAQSVASAVTRAAAATSSAPRSSEPLEPDSPAYESFQT